MYVCMCIIYTHTSHVYIYIYVLCRYIYIYICVCVLCRYTYIYIYLYIYNVTYCHMLMIWIHYQVKGFLKAAQPVVDPGPLKAEVPNITVSNLNKLAPLWLYIQELGNPKFNKTNYILRSMRLAPTCPFSPRNLLSDGHETDLHKNLAKKTVFEHFGAAVPRVNLKVRMTSVAAGGWVPEFSMFWGDWVERTLWL